MVRCWKIRAHSNRRRDPKPFRAEQILQPDLYPQLYGILYHADAYYYYPPRGDSKEGWTTSTFSGGLGYPMQIKTISVPDSILARRSAGPGYSWIWRSGRYEGYSGMVVLLIQGSHDGAGIISGARRIHSN